MRWSLWLGMAALCASPCALAAGVGAALDEGEATLELRYRYEFVDTAGFADDAHASTLRGRLNWRSGDAAGFGLTLEFDAVATVLADDYNSGAGTSSPSRDRYPVIADPDYAEVNQAYLRYTGWPRTEWRVGRQRILLDNQRFVGGVGWRQNEQTYDAVSIEHRARGGVEVFYGFVANVNRIFGGHVAAGDHASATHLLNLSKTFADGPKLTGYVYALDNRDAPAASTTTAGMRLVGETRFPRRAATYLLEYARQRERANNPVDFSASHFRAEGGLGFGPLTLHVGYELLGGERNRSGAAFRTPLATLHAFNGWADQFLATPDAGLTDAFAGLSGPAGQWRWQATLHAFASDAGGESFGEELDLSAQRKLAARYGLQLKAAYFRADAAALRDTTKLWLVLSGNFGARP